MLFRLFDQQKKEDIKEDLNELRKGLNFQVKNPLDFKNIKVFI